METGDPNVSMEIDVFNWKMATVVFIIIKYSAKIINTHPINERQRHQTTNPPRNQSTNQRHQPTYRPSNNNGKRDDRGKHVSNDGVKVILDRINLIGKEMR